MSDLRVGQTQTAFVIHPINFSLMETEDAFSADIKQTANAIWQHVISVKSVRRRDGVVEVFSIEELERSILQAFFQAGREDEFSVRTITEQTLERLQKRFNGVEVPTTIQIRECVSAIMAEHGLTEVAHQYKEYASVPFHERPFPIHPSPPSPMSIPVYQPPAAGETYVPRRRRLNDERKALTHKFQVGAHEGYITVGLYDDGQPGEIFLRMSKEGSIMSGLMDAFATAISIGLQYGVPLKVLVNKFAQARFEPNGPTQNPNIPMATSIVDYIFRWLALKFLTPEERQSVGIFAGENHQAESYIDIQNVDGSRQSKLLDPI